MSNMEEGMNDVLYQNLFQLFTFFAERKARGVFKAVQAEFLIDELLRELRRQTSPKVFDLPEDVTFNEFLNLLQVIFSDREELQTATDRVHERYISHVVGKGYLFFRKLPNKRGCFSKKISAEWNFGWCLVSPGLLKIQFINRNKEEVIQLNNETVIEVPTVKEGTSMWSVLSDSSVFQFSHHDPITAKLFVKDMRTCRDYLNQEQLADFDYKRSVKNRTAKEVKTRKVLEKERVRLESELEEERKNRKDEEIVRGLTTRLLKQEIEKSEQMQQVIYELRSKIGNDDMPLDESGEDDKSQSCENNICEHEETEITLPSREEKIQQYAYHLYATQAGDQVTSDDEEIWKQNYNLIVSTQSV